MRQKMRLAARFFSLLGASLVRHDLPALSARICFYAMFSLFPLLLLVIYGTTRIVPHLQIESLLLRMMQPYYPDVSDANSFIKRSIQSLAAAGGKIPLFSFAILAWSAGSAFIAVQQAMDIIFEVQQQRNFFARRLISFAMLVLLIILAVISSFALAFYPAFVHRISAGTVFSHWVPLLHGISRILYPFSLFVTCFIFYRFLPSRRTENYSVLIGALTATVALDLARTGFVIYAAHLVTYHFIYGGLTVVMLLILWLYIASIMLLFGAEIAASLERFGRLAVKPAVE
ncbi:YihY/virulence factor BrkB family protein [Alicyclobacillus fodiniaquatilis]|uniref:YihY/virulence factor BrkB family protein n=1 Tax=Alicyclobacillus fodiniaquatilis TaxID=1661150 RepID=A0ABW4JBQ5_9BACL